MKIFLTILKLQSGHDFHMKNLKGALFRKNVGRVTILFLCISSDGSLYLYKFHENILDGIEVIERTRFLHIKILKGHFSVKYVDGVVVLVLGTWCDGGLYLYKVS